MPVQREGSVFIFGAGASKDCDTPLTNEILWHAFCDENVRKTLPRDSSRVGDIAEVRDCLIDHFHVVDPARRNLEDARKEDFPSLTLLLSILDLSIERNRPFGGSKTHANGLSVEDLTKRRASVEYIIFEVLDHFLAQSEHSAQRELLSSALADGDDGPHVISLNYDLIADTAICGIAQERKGDEYRVDYACDVLTDAYARRTKTYGKLLKLHGSLNWLFCPGCQALQIGMSTTGNNIARSSMTGELCGYGALDKHYACGRSGCQACLCPYCQTPLRPVMITPSFVKDYNNPHIQRVWYEAERLLRSRKQAYIVGYSLPDDDLEVIHLLRRGLEGCESKDITVVTYPDDPAMHRRYVSLFGRDIVWRPIGFTQWMKEHVQTSLPATA